MAIIVPDYKQYDPKWHMMIGRGTMTMAQGGCGISTLADAVKKDPLTVGRWMEAQGYIYPNEGTEHSAIVPTLRHFGYDGSLLTPDYINGNCKSGYFQEAYKHLEKGYCVVFLLGGLESRAGGKCRNSYWSNAGHYVLGCGARNGLVLIHDPASVERTGWHAILDFAGQLIDSLNGNTKKMWRSNSRWTEGGAYTFTVNTVREGSRGGSVLLLQELLTVKGYKGVKGDALRLDGDCGENTVYAINCYQTVRRSQGVELGTNGKNDGSCGSLMWHDLLPGL